MADVTERERLLKKMKLLKDFISEAKERNLQQMKHSTDLKKTAVGNQGQHQTQRQQNLGELQQQQQQQPGSSAPTGTKSIPLKLPSTPASTSTACQLGVTLSSTSTAGQLKVSEKPQKADLPAAVQKQANEQLQKKNASQMTNSGKNTPVSSTCAHSLDIPKEVVPVVTRRIVATSSSNSQDSLCAGKGTTSILQTIKSESSEGLEKQVIMPAKYVPANVVLHTVSSGIKNRKHIMSSTTGKTVPSEVFLRLERCQSQGVSGKRISSSQQSPVQSFGITKDIDPVRKGHIISKNAENVLSRERLEHIIEACKSKLAKVQAAKKRMNSPSKPPGLKTEVSSVSSKPGLSNGEPFSAPSLLSGNEQRNELEAKDSVNKPVVHVTSVKNIKKKTDIEDQSSHHLARDTCQTPVGKTVLTEQNSVVNKEVSAENQQNGFTRLLPSRSGSLSASISVVKVAPPEELGKHFQPNPTKSVAKANLQKELKATEEKLKATRKRMGIMLKESPQKPNQSVSAEKREHQHLQQPSLKGGDGAPPQSMPTSTPFAKKRPFPNRRCLKWTPPKSPQVGAPGTTLVIGSTPNTRTLALTRTTTPVSIRGQGQTPRHRKSQLYTLVRNNSTPVQSATRVHKPSDNPASSKSFISRYKVQRISSESGKTASVPKRTVVQSRYKLMNLSSKDLPHSPVGTSGLSTTPLSAKQKAAQIIKSKYKIRRVPVSNQSSVAAQTYQPKYFSAKQRASQNTFSYVQILKRNRYNQFLYDNMYQLWYTAPSARAVRGRGYLGHQRMQSPAYFQPGFWKGGYSVGHPHNGRGFQHRRSPRLHAKMLKAMTAKAWELQWQQQYWRWSGVPYYNPVAHSMHMRRRLQIQMMKRQQWKNSLYSLRKQAVRPPFHTQKTRHLPAKPERLVMINGTVYKSSSRRLTKASSSDPAASTSSAPSAAGYSLDKSGKWQKMQTVVVRGVRFQMNTRGTQLQRLSSSGKKGKMDAGSTSGWLSPRVLGNTFTTQTQYVINRVKQRSILLAAAAIYRKKADKERKKKNCLYFTRFGKCSRGGACPFIHDPAKVAVCTRFLRGTCQVENCPFSHKVSKEKMPVCAFFLRGVCTRESCPYLHVKVTQGAQVCPDFVSGFCPLADRCPKLHTLTCPHFASRGSCPQGKKCRLQHRGEHTQPRKHRARSSSTSAHTPTDSAKPRKRPLQSDRVQPDGAQESQDNKEDSSSRPSAKHFRPDFSEQSEPQQPQGSIPQVQTVSGASAVTAHPGSEEQAGGGEAAVASVCEGEGEDGSSLPSERSLPKLPAFISLADYSFEESPQLKANLPTSSRASASQKKGCVPGQGLQIKPQL